MKVWGPVKVVGAASVPCDTALNGNVLSVDNTDENTHTSGMLVLFAANEPATGQEVSVEIHGRADSTNEWTRVAAWTDASFTWVGTTVGEYVAFGTGFTFQPETRLVIIEASGSGNTITPWVLQ